MNKKIEQLSIAILLSLGICFSSCEKSPTPIDECENPKENGLYFNAITYANSYQIVDSQMVKTLYDSNRGFKVKAVEETNWYSGLNFDNLSSDSIYVETSFQFNVFCESEFEFEVFEIQLIYKESMEHIEESQDGYYHYKNFNHLYRSLSIQNWDSLLFKDEIEAVAIVTIPDSLDDWHGQPYSSNGFYFDYENFHFTDLEFDAQTNQIKMGGNFDVSIKVLSCGYFIFYDFQDACFSLKLEENES